MMADEENESEVKPKQKDNDEQLTDGDIKRRDLILKSRNLKRLYAGSKLADCYSWKLSAISSKESMLDYSISEYISEIIHVDYTELEKIVDVPLDLLAMNNGKLLYFYYFLKRQLIEVGKFICYLSAECNHKTCSKMQATTQYRYRCSAHKRPRDCSSILYAIHTVDLFTNKLNNKDYNALNKSFPARKCKKDLGDLCRRVYRIFAHSYFHHKSLFEANELNTLLCTRFIMFFRKHGLVASAVFKKEIQIPDNALYYNQGNRKDKIKIAKIKHKQNGLRKRNELENARKHISVTSDEMNFMKQNKITELESDEVY